MENSKPVEIVEMKDDGSYQLNKENLKNILLQPEIQDLKVVVISIAGTFRQGKSFLLNFLLRYLENVNIHNSEERDDWLGSSEHALEGFGWKLSADPQTKGILIWSKIYTATIKNEKVAIILMDTQGNFDSNSSYGDSAQIFGLSTMLSSVQIYNVLGKIGQNDLNHLQFFTDYGSYVIETENKNGNSEIKPFQKLMFLVRDWLDARKLKYGLEGGNSYVKSILDNTENLKEELKKNRDLLKSCFTEISGFLMPRPGNNAVDDYDFKGQISKISPNFLEQVKQFAPLLLAPENLVIKEINGEQVTAKDFVTYFECFMDMYNNDDNLQPSAMFESTRSKYYSLMVDKASDKYATEMTEKLSYKILSGVDFEKIHIEISNAAMSFFESKKKVGEKQLQEEYQQELVKKLEEQHTYFKLVNADLVASNKDKCRAAMKDAEQHYMQLMNKKIGDEVFDLEGLQKVHNEYYQDALNLFIETTKCNGEIAKQFTTELEEKLEDRFRNFKNHNNSKLNECKLNYMNAEKAATELYLEKMDNLLDNKLFFEDEDFEAADKEQRNESLKLFEEQQKTYVEEYASFYKNELEKKLTKESKKCKKENRYNVEKYHKNIDDAFEESWMNMINSIQEKLSNMTVWSNDAFDEMHKSCSNEAIAIFDRKVLNSFEKDTKPKREELLKFFQHVKEVYLERNESNRLDGIVDTASTIGLIAGIFTPLGPIMSLVAKGGRMVGKLAHSPKELKKPKRN